MNKHDLEKKTFKENVESYAKFNDANQTVQLHSLISTIVFRCKDNSIISG